jgi:uncharacterized membrane protein YccC
MIGGETMSVKRDVGRESGDRWRWFLHSLLGMLIGLAVGVVTGDAVLGVPIGLALGTGIAVFYHRSGR